MTIKPSFIQALSKFQKVNVDVAQVGELIGGNVGVNIDMGVRDPMKGFTNACAIRMSYVINYSGIRITRGVWKTVSGADKKWYIYRVKDLLIYLHEKFGKPDLTVRNPDVSDFYGMKGILVFTVSIWNDASGHVTLWNGSSCSDNCYFNESSEAAIWLLD